jgi:hypothetical protein
MGVSQPSHEQLYFQYTFASESGSYDDLEDVLIAERLSEGTGDFPSPPYYKKMHNPAGVYVFDVANDMMGYTSDTHQIPALTFTKPYVEHHHSVQQEYVFKDNVMDSNAWAVVPGPNSSGITITREVYQDGSSWMYRCSKSGTFIEIPLPE